MPTDQNEREAPKATFWRRALQLLVFCMFTFFGFLFVGAVVTVGDGEMMISGKRIDEGQHFEAIFGLPMAVLCALFIVLFLDNKVSPVEFQAWGIKLKGASGQIMLFVIVFLALVGAIKLLW